MLGKHTEGKASVWYKWLKIKNYHLKFFIKIRVDEKVYKNTWNIV